MKYSEEKAAERMAAIRKKAQKEHPSFVEEVDRLDLASLDARLVQYTKQLEENSEAKATDEQLLEVIATKDQYEAPYKDFDKQVKLKIKYVLGLIREKGGA